MKRFVSVVAVLFVGLCSVALSQNRSYTVDDLLKVRRVAPTHRPARKPDTSPPYYCTGFDQSRSAQSNVLSISDTALRRAP